MQIKTSNCTPLSSDFLSVIITIIQVLTIKDQVTRSETPSSIPLNDTAQQKSCMTGIKVATCAMQAQALHVSTCRAARPTITRTRRGAVRCMRPMCAAAVGKHSVTGSVNHNTNTLGAR